MCMISVCLPCLQAYFLTPNHGGWLQSLNHISLAVQSQPCGTNLTEQQQHLDDSQPWHPLTSALQPPTTVTPIFITIIVKQPLQLPPSTAYMWHTMHIGPNAVHNVASCIYCAAWYVLGMYACM